MATKQNRTYSGKIICGVDEAGRGPLAGPVVAASVIFHFNNKRIPGIKDSKKLSPAKREALFYKIIKTAHCIGIGIVSNKIIDKINILRATNLAMNEAVQNMSKKPDFVMVDGIFKIKGLKSEQKAVKHGDNRVYCISAASIIAKVTRDRIMKKIHETYPLYGFVRHKGYGTQEHLKQINKFGPCPLHRKSFAPIRQSTYCP